MREGINSLADIHKAHSHIQKVDFGVFVHDPHDLCRIHGRTAADRDNNVGLKVAHLLYTFVCAGNRGIGRNVEESCMGNSFRIEYFGDLLRKSTFIKKRVGNDKRFLFVIDFLSEFFQSYTEAAAFEV